MPQSSKHSKSRFDNKEQPKTPNYETALREPQSPPHKQVRPAYETYEYYREYSTPVKAKVQGTVEFLESKHIPFFKNDVFRFFGVSKSSGYEILQASSSARRMDTLVEYNPCGSQPARRQSRGPKKPLPC
jgi:hypothetical protein